nr:hypothetical protein [Tanacetum cinerariifolium]
LVQKFLAFDEFSRVQGELFSLAAIAEFKRDPKMTNDTVAAKFGHAFVQGIFVSLEDVVELMEVGSGRASFGPNDVVVALSVGEKGYGLVPSFAASEEAAANSSRV